MLATHSDKSGKQAKTNTRAATSLILTTHSDEGGSQTKTITIAATLLILMTHCDKSGKRAKMGTMAVTSVILTKHSDGSGRQEKTNTACMSKTNLGDEFDLTMDPLNERRSFDENRLQKLVACVMGRAVFSSPKTEVH